MALRWLEQCVVRAEAASQSGRTFITRWKQTSSLRALSDELAREDDRWRALATRIGNLDR